MGEETLHLYCMYQKRFSSSSSSQSSSSRPPHRPFSGGPRKFSRPSFTGASRPGTFRRPPMHGASSFRRPPARRFGGNMGEYIDQARFINKAVITEEVEHFVPEHKFSDFLIESPLKLAIKTKGYEVPTPIQDRAIPHVLKAQDLVGIANTGTGKTAAFLIPLINKVILNPKESIIIIVPTRELAQQIDEDLKGFTGGMRIHSVCCVGGTPIGRQISELRYRKSFVIGTPGRLKDLVDRRSLNLMHFNTVVLDEADRMLDMGFIEDMRTVMAGMPSNRHTLFFSATLSKEIEKLIGEFLREPVRISVKTSDTAKTIEQDVVRIPRGKNKLDILHDLLNKKEFTKVLVFSRTKHGAERLSKDLEKKGFKSESIHGNKTQGARQRALKLFKDGKVQVLVATDVAARGLDIVDVSHVINFDIPATYDDYVHRIGRTGRANKKGIALTFVEER